jgi:hypothetical protein
MNHKRRRPKNRRSGCLMCKPHKMNGAKGCLHYSKKFGGVRAEYFAKFDQDNG